MDISVVSLFIFLIGFIAVKRIKPVLISHDHDSYHRIIQGMSILSLATIVHMLYNYDMLHAIPFISEKLYFHLSYWTMIILGISLLTNGVSVWIPLYRQVQGRQRNLDNELTLHDTLDRILHLPMHVDHKFTMIIKELYRSYAPLMIELTLGSNEQFILHCDKEGTITRRSNQDTPSGTVTDENRLIYGISVQNHIFGYLSVVFESPDTYLQASDRLKNVARKLSSLISAMINVKKIEVSEQINELQHRISSLPTDITLPELTDAVFELLKNHIHPDICLVTTRTDGKLDRFIRTSRGQKLNQINITIPSSETTFAFERGESLLIPDISMDYLFPHTPLLAKLDMRSVYAIPLIKNNITMAVLTLATARTTGFTAIELMVLDNLIPALTNLYTEALPAVRSEYDNTATLMAELVETLTAERTFEQASRRLVTFINEQLHVESVRISLLEPESPFLQSVAMAHHSTVKTTPANGILILDLMPVHKELLSQPTAGKITTGKLVLADVAETCQIASKDIPFLRIYPVSVNGSVKAFVSLASRDEKSLMTKTVSTIMVTAVGLLKEKYLYAELVADNNRTYASIEMMKTRNARQNNGVMDAYDDGGISDRFILDKTPNAVYELQTE